ncbi:MAG: hypothetical protein WDZ76_10290 [Pseudohongiellaceae bacterium]
MAHQREQMKLSYQPALSHYGPMWIVIAIVFAFLAVSGFVLWLLFQSQTIHSQPYYDYEVLQLAPAAELLDRQQAELDEWEWIDRESRIARIPVNVAMQLLAEHGSESFFPDLRSQPLP